MISQLHAGNFESYFWQVFAIWSNCGRVSAAAIQLLCQHGFGIFRPTHISINSTVNQQKLPLSDPPLY